MEANYEEEEVKEGDDDMGRYGRCDNVERLLGQGGRDEGGNDNKVRGNVFSITPLCAFITSLFETTT